MGSGGRHRDRTSRWLAGALAVAMLLGGCRSPQDDAPAHPAGPATAAQHPAEHRDPADAPIAAAPSPAPARTLRELAADPDALAAMTQWQADYAAAIRARARVLAGRDDAQSQLDFALLLPLSGASESEDAAALRWTALERASLAGEAYASWLLALECPPRRCDRSQTLARLQAQSPDNAAAWLLGLDDLDGPDAEAEADRLLAAAGRASGHDDYLHFGGRRTLQALQAVTPPPRSPAVAAAQAQVAAAAGFGDYDPAFQHALSTSATGPMPGYSSFADRCGGRADLDRTPQRRAACLAGLRRLAGADSLIASAIGLSHWVQHDNDPVLRERLRELHWLLAYSMAPPADQDARTRAYWRLGEIPALRAELEAQGRALPPPGWLPDHPRGRSLIQHGRLEQDSD